MAIQAITDEMDEVIASCPVLSRQRELLMSIDGVGRVVATNMIIIMSFTRFDDPRKFNCYAGVAPFSYSSGSSQHSKARVSHRAARCGRKTSPFGCRSGNTSGWRMS
ncbi:transposase [Phocaeicola vulgatus]